MGEYAFAILDQHDGSFVLCRDPVGVKQLYYGDSEHHLAFCSEKKPLWNLGIEPQRVLPGEVVQLESTDNNSKGCFKRRNKMVLGSDTQQKLVDESDAIREYHRVLFDAVERRVSGQDRIGIIFSGGVDSVMIAQIAKSMGSQVHCFAAGLEGSSDLEAAKQASSLLDLELYVSELSQERIDAELESIMKAIESSDHLQMDVAIPIYFAVQRAQQEGIRVMLTGQGADELFAGYPWYPEVYESQGETALSASLWDDIRNLYKDTLEREDKITMYHSIELRVPFLDPDVIDAAMNIAGSLKIKHGEVKYLHRRLADELGIPFILAWRKKEAAQHGSGAHHILKEVLDHRLDTGLIPEYRKTSIGKSGEQDGERLGSAYRYNHNVYFGNEKYQDSLNAIGEKLGVHV
jgi:asparagine synthase (glutamine-hydrolysing)